MSTKLTNSKNIRFTDEFWDKLQKVADHNQVTANGLLRIYIEKYIMKELDKDLRAIRERKRA